MPPRTHSVTLVMSCPQEPVRALLEDISFPAERFKIHKGFIEKVLSDDRNLPERVSFAYVDFDFYEPTKLALDFLHSTTSPGAIIIVDDYGFFSTGPQAAVDEFLKERNTSKIVYECFVTDSEYAHFAILTRKG